MLRFSFLDRFVVFTLLSSFAAQSLIESRSCRIARIGSGFLTISTQVPSSGLPDTTALELPEASVIEEALNELLNRKFVLMVKIAKPIDVTALYRVYVRSDVDENYVDVATWRTDWEMQPDRAGYMCPWTPSDGNIILVLGKREQLTEFVDEQTNDLRNGRRNEDKN